LKPLLFEDETLLCTSQTDHEDLAADLEEEVSLIEKNEGDIK
jgi:arginine deiminase